MTYQVLARKWRPQDFTDMVGQDHISSTLCNAIKNNRIGHAYLFVGTRGTGKTTTARIFAKAINCENPLPDSNPCNKCVNCVEITSGSSMDVLEIDGASNNGVDDIRRLRDNVQYTPARCKYKVYIIDEVHMLSTAAWNALLKTLEEPPEHVKFLFATTEPHKVLPTILSRCQRFDLKRISQGTIARRLQLVAQQENAQFDSTALNSIARAANGGMRDALSIMDQMIAFCSEQDVITEHDVSEVFGLTSSHDLGRIMSAMLSNNPKQLITEINRLSDMGRNLEQLYSDLLKFCRNLMICAISGENASDILDLDEYDLEMSQTIVKQSSAETIQKLMDGYLSYDGKLRNTLNKRVFMEMTLVRIMKDAHAVSLNDILARINHLRKTGSLNGLEGDIQESTKQIELPEPQKKNDIISPLSKEEPVKVEIEEKAEPKEKPAQATTPPAEPEQKPAPETIQETPKIEAPVIEEKDDEAPIEPLTGEPVHIEETAQENKTPEALEDEPIQIPAVAEKVTPEPNLDRTPAEKQIIDDSYDLPYSTFLDSEYIENARKKDPLNLGVKKVQGDFDENNETSGETLGLFHTVNSKNTPAKPEEAIEADSNVQENTDDAAPEIQPAIEPVPAPEAKLESPQIAEKEEVPLNEIQEDKQEYIPQQAPPEEVQPTQDNHASVSQEVFKEEAQTTPESEAESFWKNLVNNSQSTQLKVIVQNVTPVSYQENRFYAAYETGQTEFDNEAKKLLEGELKKITGNADMELMLVGASQDVEDDKPVLTSGEDVWNRVQGNPLFTDICKEFDGKIIDVRG